MYTEAVTRLSEDSLVCVLHSQFLLYVMEKPLLARRALLMAEARNPALDELFVVFKTKKHLEENAFQSLDIMALVTSEKHRQASSLHDHRCCTLLVDFWKALAESKVGPPAQYGPTGNLGTT
jgi:hypothetical protein